MGKKLDRTKPFGEIFGDGGGHAFEQDGVFFDAAGAEVVTERAVPKGKSKPSGAKIEDPVPTEKLDQLDSQLLD